MNQFSVDPALQKLLLLLLLLCCTSACASAFQVHEHLDNDLTTATTTLLTSTVAEPTDIVKTGTTTAMHSPESADTSTTTALPPITHNGAAAAPAVPINLTTKQPRVVHSNSRAAAASFNHQHGDQQPRSTSNVNSQQHFVPSPQLSPMVFPSNSLSESQARENVQPLQNIHLHYPAYASSQLHIQPTYSTTTPQTNTATTSSAGAYLPKYYKPTADNLIFGEPDRDPWRLSSGGGGGASVSAGYQYPITSNGGSGGAGGHGSVFSATGAAAATAGGKWYWMPNGSFGSAESAGPAPPIQLQPAPATTAASPFASDVLGQQPHWRWMFDQKYNGGGESGGGETGFNGGGYPSFGQPRPITPDFQRGNEHPYSFDPPGGGGGGGVAPSQRPPRPFPTQVFQYGSGEEGGPYATQISETEYTRLVKGPPTTLGTLSGEHQPQSHQQQQQLGKPKGKDGSPWKKILHVLSAAIPIGLLISAFTPQYVYVDPNSTASLSQPPSPTLPRFGNAKHGQHTANGLPLHFSHIHRALGGETESSSDASAAANFVPTNESLGNLFDEVNALFADADAAAAGNSQSNSNNHHHNHRKQTTADESENDDRDDRDDRGNSNRGSNSHRHHRHQHIDDTGDGIVEHDDDGDVEADDDEIDAATAHCKFRDICEMSVLGAAPNAHVVHRMLWTLANEKTERNGTTIGANELFGSIRRRNCSKYECTTTTLLKK